MLQCAFFRSSFVALGAMFWGLVPLGVHAQPASEPAATAPIPIERFFQRPAILEAKLSPSGTKIALTTSRGSTRVRLMVIDLTEETPKALRAASFSDADVTRFDWVGDNRLIYSVLDLEAGSGDDALFAPGLYAANPDGSATLQLVGRQGKPFVTFGNAVDHTLPWNNILLSVPVQQAGVNPDEVVIGELSFADNDIKSILPKWLNIRTGRIRAMDLGAPAGAVDWMFDSKGQARVATTRVDGRSAIYWRGPGETQWRKLMESEFLTQPFSPSAVDDAGNLYVTFRDDSNGLTVLSRFDFEKGEPQKPAMVVAQDFDFRGNMVLDRTGSRALGVRANTITERTIWFDEGMKNMQALADAQLPGRVNRLSCRRCGADDMVVLVRTFSDRDPGNLLLYKAAAKQWISIGSVLDGIDFRRMATVDLHRIKARDGRDLPVWLTQPVGLKPGKPVPAVVLVHGGPWIRNGYWQWEAFEQFLASRGYLVISPEFRGSTGYGDAHYRAGWKQWGQSMQDDVADALLWAQKQGLASSKACIAGASYGGYSTLMGLVRHPALYQCGVAWAAVTEPTLFLKGARWLDDDVSTSGRRYTLPELVGDVEKDADMLQANSPLTQVAKIKAPLLLAFGESDRRVPLVHGERLRAALIEAGRPPEWVTYPNEGHSWRQVSTEVDFARRVEKFLGQHLKADSP